MKVSLINDAVLAKEDEIDEVINPKSSNWADPDIVPAGIVVPAPNPLLTADADIKVSDIKDAVWAVVAKEALSTIPSTLEAEIYDAEVEAVMKPKSSICCEPDTVPEVTLALLNPNAAADWEVRKPDADIWADSEKYWEDVFTYEPVTDINEETWEVNVSTEDVNEAVVILIASTSDYIDAVKVCKEPVALLRGPNDAESLTPPDSKFDRRVSTDTPSTVKSEPEICNAPVILNDAVAGTILAWTWLPDVNNNDPDNSLEKVVIYLSYFFYLF